MALTTAQERELIVWEYFRPRINWLPKTDEDIQKFFEWSEKGWHKEEVLFDMSYFNALRQGKRWAGIHIHELYEPGILDGSMPYFIILGGFEHPVPPEVKDFMKKEMFKGHDAEIIENCYQEIKKHGIIMA